MNCFRSMHLNPAPLDEKGWARALLGLLAAGLLTQAWAAGDGVRAVDKSPSKEKIEWTEGDKVYEFSSDYSYVGAANTNLGNGRNDRISENNLHIQQLVA